MIYILIYLNLLLDSGHGTVVQPVSITVAYAETFHGRGFIQWHRVVISIWCALFVTSQNDVIVLFPNQRFGEVC